MKTYAQHQTFRIKIENHLDSVMSVHPHHFINILSFLIIKNLFRTHKISKTFLKKNLKTFHYIFNLDSKYYL